MASNQGVIGKKKFVYGIDIGGSYTKFGKFDKDLKLLDMNQIKSDNSSPIKLVSNIIDFIEQSGVKQEEIIGYGLGSLGVVKDNTIVKSVNLGIEDFDIKSMFTQITGNQYVVVTNDCNTATYGEYIYRNFSVPKSVVMITLGTGMGAGYIIDGKIMEGKSGLAGELGHIQIEHETDFLCNCGKIGCLESIIGSNGILQEYRRVMGDTYNHDSKITVKDIFDMAKNSADPVAIESLKKLIHYIAYTCKLIHLSTNPDLIIIGGGISQAGDYLLNEVKKELIDMDPGFMGTVHVELAQLGNEAGVYGAAHNIMNAIKNVKE